MKEEDLRESRPNCIESLPLIRDYEAESVGEIKTVKIFLSLYCWIKSSVPFQNDSSICLFIHLDSHSANDVLLASEICKSGVTMHSPPRPSYVP